MKKALVIITVYIVTVILFMSMFIGVEKADTGSYAISSFYPDLKTSLISCAFPALWGIYAIYRSKFKKEIK